MKDPPHIPLNNGLQIPQIGLGVWNMKVGEETERAVRTALDAGYRLVDTATYYRNEASVGNSVRQFINETKASRNEIIVTTKIWPSDFHDPERAFMRSLNALGLEYIDLYLIHWPSSPTSKHVWQTLERVYEQKLTRAIGVSNYEIEDLEQLFAYATVPPAMNQIKFSVFDHDLQLLEYCRSKNIAVEAYTPLESGRINDPKISAIAQSHNKSPAQIMLRWCIEHGTIPLPKSSNSDRQRENLDVFDFELTKSERSQLDNLN